MLWLLYGFFTCIILIILFPLLRIYSYSWLHSTIISLIALVAVLFLVHYYIEPSFSAWQYEREMRLTYPLVDYAAKHDPVEYHNYMDEAQDHFLHSANINMGNEVYYESDFVNVLLVKYGSRASNESLYEFLKNSVDYDKVLINIDPIYVLYHEFPEKFSDVNVDFSKLNREQYLQEIFSAAAVVVNSAIEKPVDSPTKEDVEKAKVIFQDAIKTVTKSYDEKTVIATLQKPHDPSLDKEQSAKIVIAFFDAILQRSKEEVGLFLRVTFKLNGENE